MSPANVSVFWAFAAGLLSFLSPCVLPVIPSYVSFITGSTATAAGPAGDKALPVFRRTVAFVIGFSAVFVGLGVLFSGPGMALFALSRWLTVGAGILVVVLGLNMIFDFIGFLNFEKRFHFSQRSTGMLSSAAMGMAFGAGWTPCIGPILAAILVLAGSSGSMATGVGLLVAYSLGLGLPFLLVGAFFGPVVRALRSISRHVRTIRVISGLLLVAIGTMIALGRLHELNGRLFAWGLELAQWSTNHAAAARAAGAALFALPAIAILVAAARDPRGLLERIRRVPRAAILTVLTTAAVLSAFGVFNVPAAIAAWLQYQGI